MKIRCHRSLHPGLLRRPEFSVLCPPFDMEDMVSETPRLVFEALFQDTRHIDEHIKPDEYKALPSLDYTILTAPTEFGSYGLSDLQVMEECHQCEAPPC
jgi:hypothetical protein